MRPHEQKTRITRINRARTQISLAEVYVSRRPGADAAQTIRNLIDTARSLIEEIERPTDTIVTATGEVNL